MPQTTLSVITMTTSITSITGIASMTLTIAIMMTSITINNTIAHSMRNAHIFFVLFLYPQGP